MTIALCALVETEWMSFLKKLNIVDRKGMLCNEYDETFGAVKDISISQSIFNVIGWMWGLVMVGFFGAGFIVLEWKHTSNVWECANYYALYALLGLFIVSRTGKLLIEKPSKSS